MFAKFQKHPSQNWKLNASRLTYGVCPFLLCSSSFIPSCSQYLHHSNNNSFFFCTGFKLPESLENGSICNAHSLNLLRVHFRNFSTTIMRTFQGAYIFPWYLKKSWRIFSLLPINKFHCSLKFFARIPFNSWNTPLFPQINPKTSFVPLK